VLARRVHALGVELPPRDAAQLTPVTQRFFHRVWHLPRAKNDGSELLVGQHAIATDLTFTPKPVNRVLRQDWQLVDNRLCQTNARNCLRLGLLPGSPIGSRERATAEQAGNLYPH
jgi:hypothetical protein